MMLMLFILEMLALILMRESRIPSYNPSWRSPLYPWMQVAGILCYAFFLVELGTVPLAVGGAVLGLAVLWYVLYARVGVMRESALVRLAGRLAATDFHDHDLEAELARLARERDQVMTDRFDQMIHECPIFDVREPVDRDELLLRISQRFAADSERTAQEMCDLLCRREALSSTVIRPGLAIPHVVQEGLVGIKIVLVRSRQGVTFVEGQPPVRIVFALAASPDERNAYLKALVAIAEIAQDTDFDRRWLQASGAEALREVVLVAERRREREHDAHYGQ